MDAYSMFSLISENVKWDENPATPHLVAMT